MYVPIEQHLNALMIYTYRTYEMSEYSDAPKEFQLFFIFFYTLQNNDIELSRLN